MLGIVGLMLPQSRAGLTPIWLNVLVVFLLVAAALVGPAAHLLVHNPFSRKPYIREYLTGELEFARTIWLGGLLGLICLVAYAVWNEPTSRAGYYLSMAGAGLMILYLALYYKADAAFAGTGDTSAVHVQWRSYLGMTAAFVGLLALMWLTTTITHDTQPSDFSVLTSLGPLWAWFLTMVAMPSRYPLPIQVLWKRKFLPSLLAWGLWIVSFASWQFLVLQPAWEKHPAQWALPMVPTFILLFACLAFTLVTVAFSLIKSGIRRPARHTARPQL